MWMPAVYAALHVGRKIYQDKKRMTLFRITELHVAGENILGKYNFVLFPLCFFLDITNSLSDVDIPDFLFLKHLLNRALNITYWSVCRRVCISVWWKICQHLLFLKTMNFNWVPAQSYLFVMASMNSIYASKSP